MKYKVRDEFDVKGYFYEVKNYKFRKYLNLIKKESNAKVPDLMVVMMNPGSSRPVHGEENINIETDTVPDNTQDRIMRVMLNCNLNYARILNLSDLREPKSTKLYITMEELRKNKISHSIFDDERRKEFKKFFIKGIPIIYAWGVSKKLEELAVQAMKRIDSTEYIGLQKEGFEYAFYHPLPQNYTKQREWVDRVTGMMKGRFDFKMSKKDYDKYK